MLPSAQTDDIHTLSVLVIFKVRETFPVSTAVSDLWCVTALYKLNFAEVISMYHNTTFLTLIADRIVERLYLNAVGFIGFHYRLQTWFSNCDDNLSLIK